MARSLARNTKLYVTTIDDAIGSCTGLNTFEVKVLDGYSFSQDVATQEVGVSESDSTCSGAGLARGTLSFNTALNPVDVSFSTYVRPYTSDVDTTGSLNAYADCVERILWASALGTETSWGTVTSTGAAAGEVITKQDATSIEFGLGTSNSNSLLDLTLYFVLEQTTYKILNFNVSTAEVDFSIDGIAQINWTGQGSRVLEDESAHTTIAGWTARSGATLNDYTAVPATTTNTFLRNKLSVLEITDGDIYGFDKTVAGNDTDGIAAVTSGEVTFDTLTTMTLDEYIGGIIYNTTKNEWAFMYDNDTDSVWVSETQQAMVNAWTGSDSAALYLPAQDDVDTFASASGAVITLGGTITGTDAYAEGRILNLKTGEWATVISNNTTTVTVGSSDQVLVNTWTNTDPVALYTKDQNSGAIFCIPITGASLSLENNFTYLTPEELAIVNLPLAGFAGNRLTSGSFTAYLNTGAQGSGGLLQDMLAKIQQSVSNNYHIKFLMGGSTGKRVEFDMKHANLSVPTTNVEDLITTEISFSAKPWDEANNEASFEDTNELTIEYFD